MSFNTLRPQIKSLLESVSTIQEVKSYPTLKFNGYPAAYVVPSDNEGEYETTSENVRIYAFIVRLFYETKNTGIDGALDALEDIVDTVLDALDQDDLKDGSTRVIGINLPSGYTYLNIFAHPSAWGEIEGENLMMAEIRVRIRISIDVS